MSKTINKEDLIRPLAGLGGAIPTAPDWFDWAINTPSEEKSVEVNGAKITYSAWGKPNKRGILFVHGGRAHRNWWRPFAPFFAQDRRVAALDLSGMGDSDWRDQYSLDLLVDELFAVIGEAGLAEHGRPIIVGHSFGGWVTLAAVEREGDRLGGAVVIDSPLGVPDPDEGYTVIKANNDKKTTSGPPTMRVYSKIEEPIQRFRFLPNQPAEHLYLVDYIARQGLKQAPMDLNDKAGEKGWTWKFDPAKGKNFEIHFERDLLRASQMPLGLHLWGKITICSGRRPQTFARSGQGAFSLCDECQMRIII